MGGSKSKPLFLSVLEAAKSKIHMLVDSLSSEGHLFVLQTAASSHGTEREREREKHRDLVHKDNNFIVRILLS